MVSSKNNWKENNRYLKIKAGLKVIEPKFILYENRLIRVYLLNKLRRQSVLVFGYIANPISLPIIFLTSYPEGEKKVSTISIGNCSFLRASMTGRHCSNSPSDATWNQYLIVWGSFSGIPSPNKCFRPKRKAAAFSLKGDTHLNKAKYRCMLKSYNIFTSATKLEQKLRWRKSLFQDF